MKNVVTSIVVVVLAACSENVPSPQTVPGRWYTAAQVESGEPLYQMHCAVCHGADASAAPDWRTPDDSGNYPPPPLDGSAHTWHHPLAMLDDTIANGGMRFGGVMPGFSGTLSAAERLAIIAWLQSLWPDEIYARWREIDRRSR
ncbi:MAG: cytochrome c [Woeseiaceae bacterium]|nr:cytochrome c [Woeseiaceae bacterium]